MTKMQQVLLELQAEVDRLNSTSQSLLEDAEKEPMSLRQHWVGQLQALGATRETFLVPYRYADSGWFDWQPMSPSGSGVSPCPRYRGEYCSRIS